MKLLCRGILAVMLFVPAVANAQRPSNNMQIRSAELYLDQASKTAHPDDKAKVLQDALEFSRQAVEKDPNNPRAWFTLGRVYAATGQALAADSAFDKAETMWPDYKKDAEGERYRAYVDAFNAGVAAIQQDNVDEAIRQMEAANAVYGRTPTASLNLGNLYLGKQQPEKAAAAYAAALKTLRGPDREGLSEAEQKQWAEWEKVAALNYAEILATSGKADEAIAAYKDYLAKFPDDVTARSNLAVMYIQSGKNEEASATYADLLSRDLTAADLYRVGTGLRQAEKLDLAQQAFEKSVAKNPYNRDAWYSLAYTHWDKAQALEDARSKAKITEQKNFDPKLKPEYEQMRDAMLKVQEFDPTNRNAYALLQRAYRGLADLLPTKQAGDTLRIKSAEMGQRYEALKFEVADLKVASEANGDAFNNTISGSVINLKATAGDPLNFAVTLLDEKGAAIGTQAVSVAAPAVGEEVDFSATVATPGRVAGWKYEVAK